MRIVAALQQEDVTRGGVWNASTSVWQRYDRPWDIATGHRGASQLIGTIAVAYDTPSRYNITVYRVTVTEEGVALGWSVTRLCDDAFRHGELSLETCPRAELAHPATRDPFHTRTASTGHVSAFYA